ncbi:flagellar biosynthetic protein FliQ [Hahella sp. CCB-MM4]|uniref:flagellar biosynthesis protein FliQ n=1 Tax=Hahella sp. (strain CCB-MM4) TaxID=1926491 RepID=UPI000B9A257E|nr:flagellar biosynthesis protein FliQ [Hahella sp. CCB-MM4]OZG74857.1 flagellar biosynthetic protein FliQ [Hahella sp. CCB-MM4]
MTIDQAMQLTNDMLWAAIMISAPILGVAMVVGLVISIFQVITQIQEMTLTFVPKIAAVVVVLFILGPWMLATLTVFASTLIKNIPVYF